MGEYDLSRIGLSGAREEYLHEETAQAFRKLQEAAARDGVNLSVGSGHRSIAEQQSIWDAKRKAGQSDEQIAKVNTVPGESEHHTGDAVDIIDLESPSTDFNNDFRNTKSGQWLNKNAAKYGFEKSYPNEDNDGIGREEWHYRYIGSDRAKQALNLTPSTNVAGGGPRGDGDAAIASVGENAWGSPRDRANLLMTSIFESSGTQNQTDVAVSILNRVTSGRFGLTA